MNHPLSRRTRLAGALALGLFAALPLATAAAQEAHGGHAGHAGHAPAAEPDAAMHHGQGHGDMHHGDMPHDPTMPEHPSHGDHGQMDHAQPMDQGHGQHSMTGQGRSPVPPLTDADRAAAFPVLDEHAVHDQHDGGIHHLLLVDRLEWQDADEGSALAWEINGWVGGDIDRLWLRSEGERVSGTTHEAELQLFWGHAIGPWWEGVLGVRQDFKPGSPQTWAAFGVQGMPLFGLETELTGYLGEGGQTAARLEAEYDLLLTQRLVLQPRLEANLHGRDDAARGIGAGLSEASLGLRLRYEIRREFAPYVGVEWGRAYGETADLRRAEGEDVGETRAVAGVRFWF